MDFCAIPYCKHAYRQKASMLSHVTRKVAYMNTLGQRIKDERIARGWSQQRLADEISRIKKQKISRAAVALWESGDSKSQKPENLFAAAEALCLSPKWVLDGKGEKHSHAYSISKLEPLQASEPKPLSVVVGPADMSMLHEDEQIILAAFRSADQRLRRIMLASAREVLQSFDQRSEVNKR